MSICSPFNKVAAMPEDAIVNAIFCWSYFRKVTGVSKVRLQILVPHPEKKRERTLHIPRILSDSFVWVSFSESNERIGAQGGPPDWGFALWLWEKRRLEIVFHPFRMEPGAKVYKFTFNPSDSRYIVAVGKHFLRCYFFKGEQRIQETALHEQERSDQTFHSAAWIPNSRLVMIGTSGGKILVLENMHLVRQVSITEELTRFQRYSW
ncbi:cilia-and flagella-associated protein 57 [Trichonephila clavipes]|nr:cilia-and flagella-associated protein 57 [Trichonephila clavipes]